MRQRTDQGAKHGQHLVDKRHSILEGYPMTSNRLVFGGSYGEGVLMRGSKVV